MAQAGKRVRVLAGPDADCAAGIPIEDWRLFEQLIHERAHALGVTALCVYDGPLLPGDFIPVAMRAHPLLVRRNGELRRNGEFRWEPSSRRPASARPAARATARSARPPRSSRAR